MRKILIFSLAYYPRFVGGAEVAVKEITDRMPSRELEFHMITLGDGRKMGDHRDESESSKNDDDASFEKIGNIRIHRVFQNTGVFQKIFYPFVAAKKALELHR